MSTNTQKRSFPDQIQRRRWVRHPVNLEALCTQAGEKNPWHVRVLDLSLGGCALASPQAVAPGHVLAIGMFNGSIRLSDLIDARVVYADRSDAGFWRLGCEFLRALTTGEEKSLL